MCFKRKLHVALLIRIVLIITGIVHVQKLHQGQLTVNRSVFFKMSQQYRKFQQFTAFCGGKQVDRKKQYGSQTFQPYEGTNIPLIAAYDRMNCLRIII